MDGFPTIYACLHVAFVAQFVTNICSQRLGIPRARTVFLSSTSHAVMRTDMSELNWRGMCHSILGCPV